MDALQAITEALTRVAPAAPEGTALAIYNALYGSHEGVEDDDTYQYDPRDVLTGQPWMSGTMRGAVLSVTAPDLDLDDPFGTVRIGIGRLTVQVSAVVAGDMILALGYALTRTGPQLCPECGWVGDHWDRRTMTLRCDQGHAWDALTRIQMAEPCHACQGRGVRHRDADGR